jgi:two-component system sensor histidine kinase ChvG
VLVVGSIFLSILVLPIAILFFSQFRAGLIDARVQSLQVQGEIIAGVIASSATIEANSITISPERLMELKEGESYGPADDGLSVIDFSVNPERVSPVLRRLVSPTRTRARVYDRDGVLLLDSRDLDRGGDALRFDLPPPNAERPGLFDRTWIAIRTSLGRGDLPLYRELGPENGTGYPEVAQALAGQNASMVRVNDRGEVIISVAVPVQRFRAVRGALLLSTQRGDIDQMVEAERVAMLKLLTFPILIGLLSSWLAFRMMRGVIGRSSPS